MIVLAASLALVASVQLDSATVEIELADTTAAVRAVYHAANLPDSSLRFVLMRIDGQTVTMVDGAAPAPAPALSRTIGTLEFAIPVPPDGRVETHVEYRVAGDLNRIPVFVPNVPTDPGNSRVELRVRGYTNAAALRDAFPRFVADGGTMISRPDNLPSFVLLPTGTGLWTNRVADAFVLVLVVVGSLVWYRRQRRVGAAG